MFFKLEMKMLKFIGKYFQKLEKSNGVGNWKKIIENMIIIFNWEIVLILEIYQKLFLKNSKII